MGGSHANYHVLQDQDQCRDEAADHVQMCKRVRIVLAEGIWCFGRSAADLAIDLMEGYMQAGLQFFGSGARVRRTAFLQPTDIAHRRDQVQHQGMPF